eukprot:TRINITY_DN4587_c0_g1_i1.p1 TRINITY_DN4587_c0_g1~~TRINITY_DN4587_c0_g1_i1.p1  ORF type:complete len:1096 (-),score=349.00 TRINITY_DN4587_c0_g1_i1:1021-4242(-)
MSDYPGAEHIAQVMNRMLEPNTEVIREATAEMNKLLKSPRCVAAMLDVIRHAGDPDIQRMGAVLLRMKIVGHWGRLDEGARSEYKNLMVEMLSSSDIRMDLRSALADVTAVIARIEVPEGKWDEVLDFMFQCTQVESADHRQMGIYLFKEMMETVGNLVELRFDALQDLVAKALVDSEMEVRFAAMPALAAFVDHLNTEERAKKFQDMMMPLVENIKFCLENGHEEHSYEGFEVFHLIAEDNMLHVIEPIFRDWVEFCLMVGRTESLELESRKQALFFIELILRSYPKTYIEEKLLEPTVDVIFVLLCEDEEIVNDEDSAHTAGTALLDSVCLCLPMKYVYHVVIERTEQMTKSSEAIHRKAGVTALGIMSEGCGEYITQDLKPVLDTVLAGINDSELMVRDASCFALAELSKHLQPEIAMYHEQVLPLVLGMLKTEIPEMLAFKLLHAYQQYTEHLVPEEIETYVEEALSIFFELLKGGSLMMHKLVLPSISATCLSAKHLFEKYVGPVMSLLEPHLFNRDEEMQLLRARALELAGVIAISQGRKTFDPYVQPTMDVGAELTHSDDPEVREYVVSFFGHVAQILCEEFTPYLKPCMEEFEKRLLSKEGIYMHEDKEMLQGIERDQDDVDFADYSIQILETYVEEKVAILRALGSLCRSCMPAFEEYLPKTLDLYKSLASNPLLRIEVTIRAACLRGCADVLDGVHAGFQQPTYPSWKQGEVQELHPHLQVILEWLIPQIKTTIEEDEEYEAVLAAMEVLAQVCKTIGATVLHAYPSILEASLRVLKKEAVALKLRAESFADDDDDDLEFNLYNACATNLVELFQVGGPMLADAYPAFVEAFQMYFRESLAQDYGLVALGTLAEISFEVGPEACAPFAHNLLEHALRGLDHPEPTYRRNAAFAVRNLFALCPEKMQEVPNWQEEVIPRLNKLFGEDEKEVVLDNALGAICSVSMRFPDAVPLQDMVTLVLQTLPINEDHECAQSIFEWVNFMLNNYLKEIEGQIPLFVQLMFSEVCTPEFEIFSGLQDVIFENMELLARAGFGDQIKGIAMAGIEELEEDERARMQAVLVRLK